MMKTLMAVLTLAAGIWTGTVPAAAADEKDGMLAERIQDLNLTDEQENKIADIRKEYRPKVQAAGKEFAAIVTEEENKIRAILTAEQKTKLEGLKEERRERRAEGLAQKLAHLEELDLTDAEISKIGDIRMEYRPKIEKVMKELTGTLTDAQKTARAEALKADKNRREVLAALNLTPAQKDKVAAVCKEAGALVREELGKIRNVLSDEQMAKLSDLREERKERVRDRLAHRIANLRELGLTDDQKAKIADIRNEYRPQVHEAGNKLRSTVRGELDAILAVIKG